MGPDAESCSFPKTARGRNWIGRRGCAVELTTDLLGVSGIGRLASCRVPAKLCCDEGTMPSRQPARRRRYSHTPLRSSFSAGSIREMASAVPDSASAHSGGQLRRNATETAPWRLFRIACAACKFSHTDVDSSSFPACERKFLFHRTSQVRAKPQRHILRPHQNPANEAPPMNKAVEALVTVLALVGLFCALPSSKPATTTIRAQTVVVADGSDPMPICRAKRCW